MEASAPVSLIALLHGPDRPGIVARTAGWIFARGGNILHADQHSDADEKIFFQRIEWVPAGPDAAAETGEFRAFAASLGMSARVTSSAHRPRMAIFVSKFDHCFHDLALRWKSGEYACDLVAVVSNHSDLEAAARSYGLPYHVIPVTAATKSEGEARQLALLRSLDVRRVR